MKKNLTVRYCVVQFSYWAAAMGAAAHERVQQYSLDTVLPQVMQLYLSVLEQV